MYINPKTFRQWWEVFHSINPLTELRFLGKTGKGRKGTASGYFTDCETALEAIQTLEGDYGVYAPINVIKQSCYGRKQHDTIIESPEQTTSGNDISGRQWIMIDLDPVRASGTNSTDAEKAKARDVMRQVGIFLRDQGFQSPIVADSSNGYHLYYKIHLANTPENTEIVKDFLQVIEMRFGNESVDIDLAVSDPNRIAKVIGTKTNKGSDTADRPQRESFFVQIPDTIMETDVPFIQKVAGLLPKAEAPSRFNGYSNERFDIESFISRHGIEVVKRAPFKGGQKLVLKECVFDSNHKAPDAAIFVMDNGALGYCCLHNSCSQYTWRDVRLHFEPDAYTKSDYEAYKSRIEYNSTKPKPTPTIVEESAEKGKKWLSMVDIKYQSQDDLVFIPTGITELDKKIGGLALGDVTILSGLAGAGKTSLINFIVLNAIHRGYKASVWSGELQSARFQGWIDQTAAGGAFVKSKAGYDNWWFCPRDVADKVNRWLDGKLWLYNVDYGNKWSQLFADIKDCVESKGTQLVVLDNLAAMSIDPYQGEKNDRQSQFITELKNYAKKANVAIIQVVHPRKETMNALLRMESISGSFDLVNLADNVLLAHRVGKDFVKRGTEFWGTEDVTKMQQYNEVIEVAKNRAMGVKDFLVGLWFETKSRRFLNTQGEYIVYGWQDQEQELPMAEPEIQPHQEAWELSDDLPL